MFEPYLVDHDKRQEQFREHETNHHAVGCQRPEPTTCFELRLVHIAARHNTPGELTTRNPRQRSAHTHSSLYLARTKETPKYNEHAGNTMAGLIGAYTKAKM